MIKWLVWNTQGAKDSHFAQTLKEHIKDQKPDIIALFEPYVSGLQANKTCEKIGYESIVSAEEWAKAYKTHQSH